MQFSLSYLRALQLLTLAGYALAASNRRACPLLGQQYPSPTQLSSNSAFQAATKQIENALLSNSKAYMLNETSLSIGMFSTSEEGLIYQYHHTDALLANSSKGARKVDADSIYRIGSISKLLTMYMFLVSDGDRHFNDPIAEHVPALLKAGPEWNPVTPEWNDITIGDLAGQMAGLARDFGLADLAPPKGQVALLGPSAQKVFPSIPQNEIPTCAYLGADGTYPECSTEEYIKGVASESPIFSTAYTPVYSNEAFAMIGLALQEIVGQETEVIFNSSIVDALGLTDTTYTVPEVTPKNALIPGNPLTAGWNVDLGVFGPAGGYFSSTNDLATLGKAILNSTQLSKAMTHRWMKPSSFVENFEQGVGRPWEIFRQKVNGQAVDVYTKAGDWGVYSTLFALIPQYDFGITLLTATNPGTAAGSTVRTDFPNEIFPVILPVLDDIARSQAKANYGGTYIDSKTNSSVTISTDSLNSGLLVTQWINNGVNVLKLLEITTSDIVLRLQPNQIDYGAGKIGFTSYYASAVPPSADSSDVHYFKCDGWFDVDEFTYGNIPIGQMLFTIDEDGSASDVELRAFRTTLQKRA